MASALWKACRVIRNVSYSPVFKKESRILACQRHFHKQSKLDASLPVLMPSLSPTMTEGTIVKWYKKEGDTINPGDVLCDIQTDKAVVSLDTEEEGVMAKILKPENTPNLKVGTLIAVMVEEGDDWQNAEIPEVGGQAPPTSAASPPAGIPVPSVISASSTTVDRPPLNVAFLHSAGVGPSVRKLVEEYGVNVGDLKGTGPHGRITKGDVLTVIQSKNLQKLPVDHEPQVPPPPVSHGTETSPTLAPASPATTYTPQQIPDIDGEVFIDIPNTNMRSVIAKRLTLSKTTIPHSYVTMSCNVGEVIKLRKHLVQNNVKVSVNDFIIKAVAMALQRVPAVNALYENEQVSQKFNVDVCVAVATDNGLITPIVQNAAHIGVDGISAKVRDLAERARLNKLQLHEFQGGTFTISNLGMFGISEFSAVINPPQTAIMAVGSSRVVLGESGKPESHMTVCLSYDARAIDDVQASQFLDVFKDIMENPSLTLSGTSLLKKASTEV